jgi:hypothetical protein
MIHESALRLRVGKREDREYTTKARLPTNMAWENLKSKLDVELSQLSMIERDPLALVELTLDGLSNRRSMEANSNTLMSFLTTNQHASKC